MDGNRFDEISRAIATRSSRRQALRRLGSGGVLAGLAAAAGIDRLAAAQDTSPNGTCTLNFYAETGAGPDKSAIYQGSIDLEIGADGAIDKGTFHRDDNNDYPLVGQVTGRAVNLRITLGAGRVLAVVGTAADDAMLCKGEVSGTFSGPRQRDLGTWYAYRTDNNPNVTPTTGTGDQSGNSSGNTGDTSGNGGVTDNNGPTPTPCPPIDCGSTFVLDPTTCQCGCPPPYDKCGDASCCFGGAVCNPDGSCQCPDGTEACNEVCTPSCPSGQHFDDNCQCIAETSCGSGETLCNGQCVSIMCNESQLFDNASCQCVDRCSPGQGYCGGNCIDIVNDRNNCGSCGNVCPPNMPCIAGTCECPAGQNYVNGVCQ